MSPGFFFRSRYKKWQKPTSVEEASTDTTYGDVDKTKAEPLLALPFREKRVKCVTKNGV